MAGVSQGGKKNWAWSTSITAETQPTYLALITLSFVHTEVIGPYPVRSRIMKSQFFPQSITSGKLYSVCLCVCECVCVNVCVVSVRRPTALQGKPRWYFQPNKLRTLVYFRILQARYYVKGTGRDSAAKWRVVNSRRDSWWDRTVMYRVCYYSKQCRCRKLGLC